MAKVLRVLMVEDSETDAKLVLRELASTGHSVESERVDTADRMREMLTGRTWDVVLSDWSMPTFSAPAALALVKAHGLDLPFIIVSGTIGEETAVAAMRAGAHDFVLKDRLARLAPAIERELREHQERKRHREDEVRRAAIMDTSLDAILGMDHDGRITEFNVAAERIFGHRRADVIGALLADVLVPAALRSAHAGALAHYVATGESAMIGRRVEMTALRSDGTEFEIELAVARIGTSRPPTFLGFVRDISDRKLAEAARSATEAHYQRIVETTNQGVWLLDADGKTSFVNERMASLLGVTKEQALRTSPAAYIDDGGRKNMARDFARHAAGLSAQSEVEIVRPDGTRLWARVESSPMFDAAGAYEGAFAMVLDITERRKAEEDLRVSNARFARLSELGIIGVALGDMAGNILDGNDAFLRIIGYDREDLAAGEIRWRDLTPPAWAEVSERQLKELRDGGVATPYEKAYFKKDGTTVPVLVGVALLDADRSIAFMIDLTAQKKAEEALKASEAQLLQAQKMEAIGRLAGGVAHDFNNVLSVILSYSLLIVGDLKPGDPLREDVLEIEKAGNRAADLTRQLLMFSRQEVAEPRVLDLNDVLGNMDRMLHRILGEDIDLVSLRGTALGSVRVDPGHIEQVIMNLVVNSRDAMPKGGKLTLETRNVDLDETHAREHLGVSPGPYVMLAVSDTGVGIDKATQAKMFEPFFTTKDKGKGTGLGLSTVFGIVKQNAGSVWVYSEPGKGTTFKVYIPRVDAKADAPMASMAPANLAGTETILLVEDEDQIRTVARGILRRQGYQVLEARNAGEALLHCERFTGTIDLLLTDVVMPQMSGPELATRLLRERPLIKVLCMSGYTDDALVRHGAVSAGIAYLQKPITPDLLARKVRGVLDA